MLQTANQIFGFRWSFDLLSEQYLVGDEQVEVHLYSGVAVHERSFQRPEEVLLAAEAALQRVLFEKEKGYF